MVQKLLAGFIVYAETEGYKLDTALKPVLTGIVGISTALAVLSLAVCVIRYMIAEDGSELAAAKKNATTVAIAWVILNFISTFIYAALQVISGIEV